jgi:hypothetical protein
MARKVGQSCFQVKHLATERICVHDAPGERTPVDERLIGLLQKDKENTEGTTRGNFRKRQYGGKQIWHRWYFTCDKNVHEHFRLTLFLLGKLVSLHDRAMLRIAANLGAGRVDQALVAWAELIRALEQNQNDFDPRKSAKLDDIIGSFNSHGLEQLVKQLIALDNKSFVKFWTKVSVSATPLVIELIPLVIRHCGSNDRAEVLLGYICENQVPSRSYDKGLVLGLNALLWRYMVYNHSRDDVSYEHINRCLKAFAGRIPFRFIPAVAHGFSKVVPYYGMPTVFKALVKGNASLGSKHLFKFLRSTYFTTQLGKELVLAHAETGNYSYEMYRYLLKRLAVEKDEMRTVGVLETILEKAPNRTEVYKSLLQRVIELDHMGVAAGIFENMLSKGLVPDKKILMLLFRGFSRHGHEDNCIEVLETLVNQPGVLNKYVRSEILWAFCQTYSPTVVAELYGSLVSSDHLIALDLDKVLQSPSVAALWDERRPSVDLSGAKCEVDFVNFEDFEACLNVVYYSLLRHITDERTIVHLYDAYKRFVLAHRTRPRSFVVDRFVHSLCELSTSPTAVDTAYALFVDAISSLKFSNGMKGESRLLSAKWLCHALATRDIERATTLIDMIVEARYPLQSQYLVPIILRYLNDGRQSEALKWYNYGRSYGLEFENSLIQNLAKNQHVAEIESVGAPAL